MTLPVLPSLLAFDVRPTESGSPPADVAAAFKQVLSTALGSPIAGTVLSSVPASSTSQQASGFRLPAPEEGETGDAIIATLAPIAAQPVVTPPLPNVSGAMGSDSLDPFTNAGIDAVRHGSIESDPIAVLTEPALTFVPAVPGAVIPAPTVATPGTSPPLSSLPELHPEFRDRLERVIDRMESEFEYKIEIVETVRSQSRQDALYAQGRERPGQVVTWTRNSRHTDGLAADLLIDGSYLNPLGYERLAQVARDEGLRTLGPRDKGHIELSGTALAQTQIPAEHTVVTRAPQTTEAPAWAVRGAPLAAMPKGERARQVLALNPNDNSHRPPARETRAGTMPQPTERTISVAEVAAVAPVASVAAVATVAVAGAYAAPLREERTEKPARPVAPVATPGSGNWGQTPISKQSAWDSVGGVGNRGLTPIPAIEQSPATMDNIARPEAAFQLEDRHVDPIEARDAAVPNDRPDTHHAMNLEQPAAEAPAGTKPASIDRSTTLLSADRIAELLDLRDTAAERPLSSVLLRLDAPDGTEDRIRIGLRGTSLGADFDMADRHLADDLGRNLAELARSVERHGLEPEQLLVRSSWTRDSTTALSQAVAAERESLRSAAAASAGNGTASGRDGRAPRQDTPHEESPRQKPRRGSQGDR